MAGGIGAITATALLFGSLDAADQRAEARTFAGTSATSSAASPQVDRGSTGPTGERSQPTPDVLSMPSNPPIDSGNKPGGKTTGSVGENKNNSGNGNGKAAQNDQRKSSAKRSNSDTRSQRADTQKRSTRGNARSAVPTKAALKKAMPNFSLEQIQNARTIAETGRSMGLSKRDVLIALMTAMQESGLRNLDYGDRDSVGLFQQRASMGWGSVDQIMDPKYTSKKFYEGLERIRNRDSLELWQAAQEVQVSAFPKAYAKHEGSMRNLLNGLQSVGLVK